MFGVIILLCGACFGIPKYLKWKQRRDSYGLIYELALLEQFKEQAALEFQLTNGYPIKLQDINVYVSPFPDWVKQLNRCVDEEGPDGKLVHPSAMEFVYIFNVVGVPSKIRLLRDYAGFAAGTEISASICKIFFALQEIEAAKQQLARTEDWKKGHPVRWDDVKNIIHSSGIPVDCILFMPNPIGTPATGRLQRPWKGLPAGFEISSAYPVRSQSKM